MTPVSPHDLQRITRLPDGTHTAEILSQVRYSDLEVRQPALPKEHGYTKRNSSTFSTCAGPWAFLLLVAAAALRVSAFSAPGVWRARPGGSEGERGSIAVHCIFMVQC